ncbi:nuclear transport factor 2 family protein [Chitinophaga varians]|uniref:nuclear transport factor 2 family protein n=1 Tax=Chitinophaga varians TaxID=2202339 RepID=UPI00165F72A0|nr:nuclear transport factor 2 family protein [Chitinophaga varians]MBC9912606.1 nuclear transport factor 2 family protein [Chitinophaga varians]
MKNTVAFLVALLCSSLALTSHAQTKADSLAIRQAALDYIESQHRHDTARMARCLHPRLVKRTFWKYSKQPSREYLRESHADEMILLAGNYNTKGDKFPANPRKEVVLLDVSTQTAAVKLYADEWIDYMHLVKLNDEWKIINVLWQFNNPEKHR